MISPSVYKPVRFFTLTFLVTFAAWGAAAYFAARPDGEALAGLFLFPGLMAPFAVALGLILTSGSADLKRGFVRKLTDLRLIRPAVFLPSLLIMPLAVLASALVSIALGGSPEQLRFAEGFSFAISTIPSLLVIAMAAAFEELGWRSYAMDSLNVKRDYFRATLIFAVLWAAWHLPLFAIRGSYQNVILQQSPLYALNFFASVIPMAFVLSWVCRASGGSILAAILFHFVINISQEALQITQATKCIETLVVCLIAALVVYFNRSMFFEKNQGEPLTHER